MPLTTVDNEDGLARQNLRRLFILRNITIACICVGIVLAITVFSMKMSLPSVAFVIAMLCILNLWTGWRLKTGHQYSDTELFIQLVLDVAGLSGIFYFTGGATNPFVWFLLLPLIIAATLLPRKKTWLMAALTILSYSLLLYHGSGQESGQDSAQLAHMENHSGFQMHIFGMWVGFVMSAGFVAIFIVGMAHGLRERDRKLAEAREQVLQNERLVALGTLAAGAAHELGTPLGTMAILATDMEQESVTHYPELHDSLKLFSQQIARCKEALSVISASAGVSRAEEGHAMPVDAFLEQLTADWGKQRPGAGLDYRVTSSQTRCRIIAERTLLQALINILNNAADVSTSPVELEAKWNEKILKLAIADRGPGVHQAIHDTLGKQPVTTKDEGMGVGLYLAHASIKRMGGTLKIANRAGGGTVTHITLPLLDSMTNENE